MRTKLLFLFLISIYLINNPVFAQEPAGLQGVEPKFDFPGLEKKISMDFHLMDVLDVLRFISTKAEVNIVTSKNVAGRATLFISNISLGDVLDIVLLTNNLAAEKRGDIIYVMTGEDYFGLYGEGYYDKRIIKTMRLKYAVPANIAAILQEVKSSIGKVLIDEVTGTVVMIDTPEKIEQMLGVVEKAELPTVTRTYPTITKNFELQYAKVEDVSKAIKEILTENVGSVQYDTRTNRLIVSDLPQKMEKIENMIRVFDREIRQVLIEAQILEITLSDQFQGGINWEYLFDRMKKPVMADFVVKFPLTLTSSGTLTVGTVAADKYTATLQLLETLGKVNILSTPQIMVVDGEEATFLVGSREPYATSTQTVGTATSTAQEITFIDVGVQLKVTPKINEKGFILMELKPEVSTISGWYEATIGTGDDQAVNKIPIVNTSTTETTVLVKDGSTVLLAGMIKDTETETIKRYPFFGGIPILGALFRSKDNKIEKRELILLITPHIISGGEYTDNLREEMKPRLPFRH
ncbi:MAG: secretin N-terminal domain-containing protein [Thermodesulfobacteriota bacterium]